MFILNYLLLITASHTLRDFIDQHNKLAIEIIKNIAHEDKFIVSIIFARKL